MNNYDVRKALEEIIERLTYKPTHKFGLRVGGDYGPDQVFGVQTMSVIDADSRQVIPEHHHQFNLATVATYIQRADGDLDKLFHAILDDLLAEVIAFERHEAQEFFRIDGEPHRRPHHPEGHGDT